MSDLINILKTNRPFLEDLLKRRFFIQQSFDIYGGVAGLYDLGPPACALKSQIIDIWRNHFILEENMFEVACSNLAPHIALQASGHVDKFCDFMVRDTTTMQCYRADKLIEEWCQNQLEAPNIKLDQEVVGKI